MMRKLLILGVAIVLVSCQKDVQIVCESNGMEGELCSEDVWSDGVHQYSIQYAYEDGGVDVKEKAFVKKNKIDFYLKYARKTSGDTLIVERYKEQSGEVSFVNGDKVLNENIIEVYSDLESVKFEFENDLIRKEVAWQNGEVVDSIVYSYYEGSDSLYQMKIYDALGEVTQSSTFVWNSNLLVVETVVDGDSDKLGERITQFDSNENFIWKEERNESGHLLTRLVWSYEGENIKSIDKFDGNGNLIERIEKQYIGQ